MVFPVVIWTWELDYKESWVPKNWRFWTVVLEKTLASPLACKEIQPVHSKGDHSLVFIGRTDVEVETPILWPPDVKSWLIGKDLDAGRDWGQKEKVRQRMRWLGGITTRWTWVWVNSGSWWWTGRPGVLWSMGSQRVGHDWATELNWVGETCILSHKKEWSIAACNQEGELWKYYAKWKKSEQEVTYYMISFIWNVQNR